jgi:DNA mismatch endonuclease (patch repair protein)
MPKKIDKETRSFIMSKVHSKDTSPEKIVRSFLHKHGFRFRLHRKDLDGSPDIVLPKYKTVIFVHGCFWHRHHNCKRASMPVNNAEYWQKKFDRNVKRDQQNIITLKSQGWNVIVIWECEVKDREKLMEKVALIKRHF